MSSGSIRIIQLPEKSSVNTDDYMAVDSSANGTKKVKFTDLLDDNLSVQNKAADAQATGEAINNVNARVDNMINTQTNAEVTTLWTGTLENKNQSVTLSKSIANFDFVDVYIEGVDTQFLRFPVTNTIISDIQTQNMSDDGSSQFLRWWETRLQISGTTATITKCIQCYWDDFASHPVVSVATSSAATVKRIDGVKIGHVENDEIVDARVSYDGSTYETLGDSIRGQVLSVIDYVNKIEIENYENASLGTPIDIEAYQNHNQFVYLSGNPYNTIGFSTGAKYNYYAIPINGLQKVRITGSFSGTSIKSVVFADDNDTLIDYYPKEYIPSPGQVVNVLCDVPTTATKMYVNELTTVAALEVEEVVLYFKLDNDSFTKSIAENLPLSIEDYENEIVAKEATRYENYCWNQTNPGTPIALSGWEYIEVNVKAGETVYITGSGGSSVRFFGVFDKLGNSIYHYPSISTTEFVDYEYTIPDGGVLIRVNARTTVRNANVGGIDRTSFVKTNSETSHPIARETSEGIYAIGNDNYVYTVNVNGSNNGTFCYTNFTYGSGSFKAVGDDITPVNLNMVGYVGANHGYYYGYDCTITAHGLTEANIGETFIDGNNNTWMLLKIISSNVIEICSLDENVWFKLKEAIIPSTVEFGGNTLTIESSSHIQIHPSIKNYSISLIENTSKKAVFAESYDIFDIGVGVNALINNVGNNTNDSIVEFSDAFVTIRNLYEFQPNGVVVQKGNYVFRKANRPLNFYGGVQSMGFGSDNYFAVPLTTYKQLTLRSGSAVYFSKSVWDDVNKPPFLYEQATKIGTNAYVEMFFTGFLMDESNRNDLIVNDAGFIYTSNKMYPFMVQPQRALAEGSSISFTAFRVPSYVNELSNDIPFFNYFKVDDAYYLIIKTLGSLSISLDLPDEMCGMNVETLISEYVSTNTEIVVNALDVIATDEGTLFVKLSK